MASMEPHALMKALGDEAATYRRFRVVVSLPATRNEDRVEMVVFCSARNWQQAHRMVQDRIDRGLCIGRIDPVVGFPG